MGHRLRTQGATASGKVLLFAPLVASLLLFEPACSSVARRPSPADGEAGAGADEDDTTPGGGLVGNPGVGTGNNPSNGGSAAGGTPVFGQGGVTGTAGTFGTGDTFGAGGVFATGGVPGAGGTTPVGPGVGGSLLPGFGSGGFMGVVPPSLTGGTNF